jgi:hypothetical protein
MSNFQNLSSKDVKELINKINQYKNALKKLYSIAEDQGEFDEHAEDFYKSIFFSYLDDKEQTNGN